MRKLLLLSMCCFAQSLDAFNNAALFPAIPTLEVITGITQNQSVWIISAFQLTFASFLLISGRISDVYNPKNAFIISIASLGILSIVVGFVNNAISIIILRALIGISSALLITSALTLLVHTFPDPHEQAQAIGILGGCGAVADILGLLIGAVLIQRASYHWVFWFVALIAIPVALGSVFIIPADIAKYDHKPETCAEKWKSLDLIGILILTVALILFIYGVTSGSANGWTAAGVLIPLIVAILLMAVFLYWETLIPSDKAAIPPRTWFYNNFSVLFASALLPFFWWNTMFFVFTTLWQDVFHWTIISTALHMVPIGVAAFVMSFTGSLSKSFSPKWIILTGLSMVAAATALVAVHSSRPEDYWPHLFPAFTLGSAGVMLVYSHTNIAILQAAPASMAGTVGAIFNSALQIGSVIGLVAFNSIQTSVAATHVGSEDRTGRTAAFWFLLGFVLVEIISVACFYRRETNQEDEMDAHGHGNSIASDSSKGKSFWELCC